MSKLSRNERSWVLYDWANSAYYTIVTCSVFPVWFGIMLQNEGLSLTQISFRFGLLNSLATLFIAIPAIFLGTISDLRGLRQRLFIPFWLLGIITTGAMILVDAYSSTVAMILYFFTFLGFAGANLYYDGTLQFVTTPERRTRVSTWGVSLGYIGGCTIPLLVSIAIILLMTDRGLLSEIPVLSIKISFVLTSLWWFVFSIPFLENINQRHEFVSLPKPDRQSFLNLVGWYRKIRADRRIFLFLIAYFLYIDGVNTIIKMVVNYSSSLGFPPLYMLIGILVIQVFCFPLTLLYTKLSGFVGIRGMIYTGIFVYCLIVLTGTVIPLLPENLLLVGFGVASLLVALAQGGILTVSRLYYKVLVPENNSSIEFYAFYNTMGRFSSLIGPILIGSVARITFLWGFASERVSYSFGVASLLVMFLLSAVFLAASGRNKSTDSSAAGANNSGKKAITGNVSDS